MKGHLSFEENELIDKIESMLHGEDIEIDEFDEIEEMSGDD